MFVYREAYYKARQEPKKDDAVAYESWDKEMEQIKDKADIIIAKHRNGPIKNIQLHFDSNLTKFANLQSK